MAGYEMGADDACVGGGWAVDALRDEQRRPHGGLDLWRWANEHKRAATSTFDKQTFYVGAMCSLGTAPNSRTHRRPRGEVVKGMKRFVPWRGRHPPLEIRDFT